MISQCSVVLVKSNKQFFGFIIKKCKYFERVSVAFYAWLLDIDFLKSSFLSLFIYIFHCLINSCIYYNYYIFLDNERLFLGLTSHKLMHIHDRTQGVFSMQICIRFFFVTMVVSSPLCSKMPVSNWTVYFLQKSLSIWTEKQQFGFHNILIEFACQGYFQS